MVENQRHNAHAGIARGGPAVIDAGLRAFMLNVYNYMALGLAFTGVIALMLANASGTLAAPTALGELLFYSPLRWVVMLAPIGVVLWLSARIQSMSPASAQISFWIFAGLMGMSLASVFLVYTHASIARVFFITAAAFGGLSLYGYTTRRNLSGLGSFLMMGLIGIIIASLVNIFIASSAFQFAISVIGVLVFAGLTAYDTQQIKEMYLESDGSEVMEKKAILGALRLYLDFINLFIMLLSLFGNRE